MTDTRLVGPRYHTKLFDRHRSRGSVQQEADVSSSILSSPPDPALFEADLACDSSDFLNDSNRISPSFSPALSPPAEPEVEDDEAVGAELRSGAHRKAVWCRARFATMRADRTMLIAKFGVDKDIFRTSILRLESAVRYRYDLASSLKVIIVEMVAVGTNSGNNYIAQAI